MTIADIISSHYSSLQAICKDNSRMVSKCKTDEDWLNDVIYTALKKFKDKDISEEEGMAYLERNVRNAITYKYKKIDDTIVLLGDIDCGLF